MNMLIVCFQDQGIQWWHNKTSNASTCFTAKASNIVTGAINAKNIHSHLLTCNFLINYAYPMFPDACDPLLVLPGLRFPNILTLNAFTGNM